MTEERAFFWPAYLIISILIFIPIFLSMAKVSGGESFNEQLIANDLALLVDSVLGAPGEINIEYNVTGELDRFFGIGFQEPCVFSIASGATSLSSATRAWCVDNKNLEKEYLDFFDYSRVKIQKKSEKLSVEGE